MSNQITILFGVFFRWTFPGTSVVSTYFIGMYSTVIAWRDFIDSFENCLTRTAARIIASLSYFVAVCFVLSIKIPCGLEKPFPTWNHSAFWFVFFVLVVEAALRKSAMGNLNANLIIWLHFISKFCTLCGFVSELVWTCCWLNGVLVVDLFLIFHFQPLIYESLNLLT